MAKVTKKFVGEYVEKNGFPEVGYFQEKSDLQKFYKHLSDAELDEWLEVEGLSYKESGSSQIDRMRKCMAILYMHFPKTPSAPKSKRKYEQTTEELMQMVMDNDVLIEDTEDERILRMRAIMALRAAGHIQ